MSLQGQAGSNPTPSGSGHPANSHASAAPPTSQIAYRRNGMPVNQKCLVCGKPATGFHYQQCTCEGCKGFFARIIRKNKEGDLKCKGMENCEITASTEKLCPKCRFAKCVAIGMDRGCVMNEDERREYNDKRAAGKQKREEEKHVEEEQHLEEKHVEKIGSSYTQTFSTGNIDRCLEVARQGRPEQGITDLLENFLSTCLPEDILETVKMPERISDLVKVMLLWAAQETCKLQHKDNVWTMNGVESLGSLNEEMPDFTYCFWWLSRILGRYQLDEKELGLVLLVALLRADATDKIKKDILGGILERYLDLICRLALHKEGGNRTASQSCVLS